MAVDFVEIERNTSLLFEIIQNKTYRYVNRRTELHIPVDYYKNCNNRDKGIPIYLKDSRTCFIRQLFDIVK